MKSLPIFTAVCLMTPLTQSYAQNSLPPETDYVVADENGHLFVDGKRQRFWAITGKLFAQPKIEANDSPEIRAQKVKDARAGTEVLLKRFQDLGINGLRMWNAVPNTDDYEIGDGSPADSVDYFLKRASEMGFRVWNAGFGGRMGKVAPSDVSILDDPATSDAWKTAAGEYANPGGDRKPVSRRNIARVWDPRLEALYIQQMQANADHLNKHNGLRWADDPVFAIWELTNEEWWMRKMLAGSWQKEPEFFRNSLLTKWHEFLTKKYKTDEALAAAWGKLLTGESLEKQTVLLAPMAGKTDPAASMNDSNPLAREALMGLAQTYSRSDFSFARGSDVTEFFLGLQMAHKERVTKAVRGFGRGTALSPIILDTGIGYEIHSQYLHQNADAVAHDAYVKGWGSPYAEPDVSATPDPQQQMVKKLDAERSHANSGPWVNWLRKPPGISQGVPWLEQNRTEGKPYLVYETQIQQPAKYRADFPLRILALASIQDWDWITWHYFGDGSMDRVGVVDRPFDRALDVSAGGHVQGYHFTYDEVQNSLMRAAAFAFREEAFAPASNPTKFIYGKKSLFDPASMDYAGSYGERGMDMLQTTYQYGVRIEIDPDREDDEIIGPVVGFKERNTHNPYTPTKEITFDWKKGFLRMDAPATIAFAGSLAAVGNRLEFSDGTILKDVKIANPEGIFDPVSKEENYLAFAFYSLDGKALADSKKASISLQSTSFNTGFEIDPARIEKNQLTKGSVKAGQLPVLVARVGATVTSPSLKGMRYTFFDWHMNKIGEGTIEADTLLIPNDLPIFVIELDR